MPELKNLDFSSYSKMLKLYQETLGIVDEETNKYNKAEEQQNTEMKIYYSKRVMRATDILTEIAEKLFNHLLLQELYRLAPEDLRNASENLLNSDKVQ